MENVHDELWYYPPGGIPTGSNGTVLLSFEASLTPQDLANGVRFAIVETAAGQSPVQLLRYSVLGPDLPPAGSPISVYVEFILSCSSQPGQLVVRHAFANMSYCHPSRGADPDAFEDVSGGQSLVVARAENFGLAVADENGVLGSRATPQDALMCSGGPGTGISLEQARAEMRQLKSDARARIEQNGDSGVLGVYFDAEGTQCQGSILPGQPGTVYVLAKMNGLSACGIAGAEFRFTGIPDSWTTYSVPNPAMFAQGDPFGDGVVAVWPCAKPENGTILLYTVLVLATVTEENLEFQLHGRNPGLNPLFQSPAILLCDFPMFTYIGVETMPCFVNSNTPRTCEIKVPVEESTWSRVKGLYRD